MATARPYEAPEEPQEETQEEPPKMRFRPMKLAELRSLPPVRWLISGIIPEGMLSVLYGGYGSGKSFTALDMCLCLDTGRAWHGHKVQHLPERIVYIAAEGKRGVAQRMDAWRIHNHMDAEPDLLVIGEAAQLHLRNDIAELKLGIRSVLEPGVNPALIVIDTLARSMVGMKENDSADMGLAIEGAASLQREFGCHVMLVHHSGWAAEHARGSNSLPAACETEIMVSNDSGILTMKCKKQKDGKPFPDLKFRLKGITLPYSEDADELAANTDSAVLEDYMPETKAENKRTLTEADRAVLNVFECFPRGHELRHADLKTKSGYQGATLGRILDKLTDLGHISVFGTGKDKRYVRQFGTSESVPNSHDDMAQTGSNSDFETGTDSERTNVYQVYQEDLVHGTHGTKPPIGVCTKDCTVPNDVPNNVSDISEGKRQKQTKQKQLPTCAQCGAPSKYAAIDGSIPLCQDHFMAYTSISSYPDFPCDTCGGTAWGHMLGGPDNGHVCMNCLPSLVNTRGNQPGKRKGTAKRSLDSIIDERGKSA